MVKNLLSYANFTRIFVGELAESLASLSLRNTDGKVIFEFPFEMGSGSAASGNIFPKSVVPCLFDGTLAGSMDLSFLPQHELHTAAISDLAHRLSPWFMGRAAHQIQAAQWLASTYHSLRPEQRDWVGVYWTTPSGLIVGPYIGPRTPHIRIAEGQGLCGLAVKEKRTVNVADVQVDPRFLACSTSTRSEIVIPICDAGGEVIGELDIDSNQHASFDSQTQRDLENACQQFGALLGK